MASIDAVTWYHTSDIFQAIILVFNETKQVALVLLWEHLSDGEGLAVNSLQTNGERLTSFRRLAVLRIISIQMLRKNVQLTIRISHI